MTAKTTKKVKAKGPGPTATYLAIKKRQAAAADAAAKAAEKADAKADAKDAAKAVEG